MYIPHANEEKRIPILHQLLQAEPLAALVTLSSSGLLATHLPMVLEPSAGPFGTLRGRPFSLPHSPEQGNRVTTDWPGRCHGSS